MEQPESERPRHLRQMIKSEVLQGRLGRWGENVLRAGIFCIQWVLLIEHELNPEKRKEDFEAMPHGTNVAASLCTLPSLTLPETLHPVLPAS